MLIIFFYILWLYYSFNFPVTIFQSQFTLSFHLEYNYSNQALSGKINNHGWVPVFACHDSLETPVVSMSLPTPTTYSWQNCSHREPQHRHCVGAMLAQAGRGWEHHVISLTLTQRQSKVTRKNVIKSEPGPYLNVSLTSAVALGDKVCCHYEGILKDRELQREIRTCGWSNKYQ